MLSNRAKARIRRNKARRIQCRTVSGRALYNLIRSCHLRTINSAVKLLLEDASLLRDSHFATRKPVITQVLAHMPKGGFKRGQLTAIAASTPRSRGRVNMFALMDTFNGDAIKLTGLETHKFQECLDNPPPPSESLKRAMVKFRDVAVGGKHVTRREADAAFVLGLDPASSKGDTTGMTIMKGRSDFGVQGHIDKDGAFSLVSFNLINNPEEGHGTEQSG